MSGRDFSGSQEAARVFGQIGQAKRVGDVAPAFADHAGDVAVRIAVVGAKMGVSRSLFERIEVRALHILDDGDLERFAVPRLNDDDGNLMETRPLRRSPAALASDDFVSVGDARDGANDNRLDDPALLDGSGEFIELRIVEPFSRVAWIGAQELDGRLACPAGDLGMLRVRPA